MYKMMKLEILMKDELPHVPNEAIVCALFPGYGCTYLYKDDVVALYRSLHDIIVSINEKQGKTQASSTKVQKKQRGEV